MPRRSIEIQTDFPSSAWSDSFLEDAEEASRIRIASGFTDLRGARQLMDALSPSTAIDFLLGLSGCEGPDVVRELQKHPTINVRGSRVPEFHWKAASVESPSGRALYVGSANFTRKGLSGAGEIMVRLAGKALDVSAWDSFQESFDSFFFEGATFAGDALLRVLERVEAAADEARGAQADLDDLVKRAVDDLNIVDVADVSAWFILWDERFTAAETRIIERALGPWPSEAWTRGQCPDIVAPRVRVGDVALAYDREDTAFVLGRVGRLESVDFGRGRTAWITDINHLADRVESRERPAAYASIRKILGPMALSEGGRILPPDYRNVLAAVRSSP
jgi:hypothetical protein